MPELAYDVNLGGSPNLGNISNNLSGNSNINSIAINPRFSGWEDLVAERLVAIPSLRKEDESRFRAYLMEPDCELYREAEEHAASYNKPIEAENVIALTHMLQLHFSCRDAITSPLRVREADMFLNNFFGLLNLGLPKEKVGIVLYETLYHYVAVSSQWLERGLIDRVVFTEAYSGRIKTGPEPDSTIAGKQIFSGGTFNFDKPYGAGCYALVNEHLKSQAKSRKHFWAIQDLVANHPSFAGDAGYFTYPQNILIGGRFRKFRRSRVISLEEMLRKIGCEQYTH